jgi:hypothetical protein
MTCTFKLSRRLAADLRFVVILAAGLVACGGSPTGANDGGTAAPGWLSVELTTPNSDDGAVQLRISGPAIDSVKAAVPYNGFGQASGSSADMVLTGTIHTGTVAHFRVADVSRAAQYAVTVTAAAQRGSYALRPTSGYRTSVVH